MGGHGAQQKKKEKPAWAYQAAGRDLTDDFDRETLAN